MERRVPSFPVMFEKIEPTRFTKGDMKLYYAHEWEAYQKSLHRDREIPEVDTDSTSDSLDDDSTQPRLSDSDLSDPGLSDSDFSDPDLASSNPANSALPSSASVRDSAASPDIAIESTASSQSSTSSISSTSSTSASFTPPPDFARHSRRCCVCSHPDRDSIEGDFIRWRSPELIAKEFKIADRASIYRHAHSTGLFAWRRRELGRVLEGVLDFVDHIDIESADVIVRAVRAYAHLDQNGNWFEPVRTNFVLTKSVPAISRPENVDQSPTNRPQTRERRSARRASLIPVARKRKSPAAKISNSNGRHFKKSLKSMNTKEKANS
jgi:hypothetical protein